MNKVITKRIDPPIPSCAYDWAAWREGNEDVVGFGATAEDAYFDLLDQESVYLKE